MVPKLVCVCKILSLACISIPITNVILYTCTQEWYLCIANKKKEKKAIKCPFWGLTMWNDTKMAPTTQWPLWLLWQFVTPTRCPTCLGPQPLEWHPAAPPILSSVWASVPGCWKQYLWLCSHPSWLSTHPWPPSVVHWMLPRLLSHLTDSSLQSPPAPSP